MKRYLAFGFLLFVLGLWGPRACQNARAQVPIQGIFPAAFNTTFDPNRFGGLSNPNVSFSCITAVVAGKCNTGFNATCNGTGSDSAAWAAWVAAAVAANPQTAVLYVPPGSNCVLDAGGTNGCVTNDCSVHGNDGIRNPIIWMYQAMVSNVGRVGGWGFFSNNVSQALINQANPGDTCVTVNDGNVSRFIVGRWIVVTALATQTFGNPPNFQLFEYRLVTSISGNLVCFAQPLSNTYKTTYPQMDLGSGVSPNLGGPAQIYILEPSWNTNVQVFGGVLLSVNPSTQLNVVGNNITIVDTLIPNSTAPSAGVTQTFVRSNMGSSIGGGVEVDKNITTLNFIQSNFDLVTVQSASVTTLNAVASTFRRSMGGTAFNTNLTNSIFLTGPNLGLQAGATCCGRSNNTVLNGVTLPLAISEFHRTLISAYSFSNGVLTIPKASGEYTSVGAGIWVPGFKYYVGDSDGSNSCSPANTFTVSDVQDAGVNVNIVTNLPSISFGNTCGAGTRAPTTFGAYQAMSLTQTASGPANLLSNPEMVPP